METVIINDLEWMTENLTGHGGTKIGDGNWSYTWEQVMKAIEELGDGWRLPTFEEFKGLRDTVNTWDRERKNRWLDEIENMFCCNCWPYGYSVRLVRDSFRKRSKKLRKDIIKGIIEKILEKNTDKIDFSMVVTCGGKEAKTTALKVYNDNLLYIEYIDSLGYDREINSNDIYDISIDDLIDIYNSIRC